MEVTPDLHASKRLPSAPRPGNALPSHCINTIALFVAEIRQVCLTLCLCTVAEYAATVAIAGYRRTRGFPEKHAEFLACRFVDGTATQHEQPRNFAAVLAGFLRDTSSRLCS